MGRFPSGQREQTVNLPSQTSVVRIHPCPPSPFSGNLRKAPSAGMAELADAHDSGSCARTCLQVQVLFPAPSALTIGAASELIRNDGFAFLYAKAGPLPPSSPVFRRITRLGLQYGQGSFVNLSGQPRWDFVSRGIIRICRVPRVRRVIRVIRVIRVRIENHVPINHKQPGVDCATVQSTPGHVLWLRFLPLPEQSHEARQEPIRFLRSRRPAVCPGVAIDIILFYLPCATRFFLSLISPVSPHLFRGCFNSLLCYDEAVKEFKIIFFSTSIICAVFVLPVLVCRDESVPPAIESPLIS